MSPQLYASFAEINVVTGVGHLLWAATDWTHAVGRQPGSAVGWRQFGRADPFGEGRDRVWFNFEVAAGVFFAGTGVSLASLAGG
jgi:hypothetical protein